MAILLNAHIFIIYLADILTQCLRLLAEMMYEGENKFTPRGSGEGGHIGFGGFFFIDTLLL